MKSMKLIFSLVVMSAAMSGCYLRHSQPYYVYAPDMHFSVALKAQKEGAMRPLPDGAIPRDFRPYSISSLEESKAHLNPVVRSKESLLQGQKLFNVYCIVCHGQYGEGNGLVSAMPNWPRPLLPRPPTLQSEKIRDYKDGQIFHIITLGQNIMPSYAEKLNDEERWSIVHYIRALYRAKHPSDDDMKKAEGYVEDNL